MEKVINTASVIGGFEYSDCYFPDNDARFTFDFIRSNMSYGCIAANYVESLGSTRKEGIWLTKVRNRISGEQFTIRFKVLINACGLFVDALNKTNKEITEHHHLFSKGILLIVNKVTDSNKILTFFADDDRLFFVILMGPKTCIGTTNIQVERPYAYVNDEDRQFVLDNANKLLQLDKTLTSNDVIAECCGVRPLAIKGLGGEAVA